MAMSNVSTSHEVAMWPRMVARFETARVVLCRAIFFITVLGLKFPLAQCCRASRAKPVLGFLALVIVPFLLHCHASLLTSVQFAAHGVLIWHVLTAVWITIPLMVIGFVILCACRVPGPYFVFCGSLVTVASFHYFIIPLMQPSWFGTIVLHLMFLLFEDLPMAAWIWSLYHVVRLQEHVRNNPAFRDCPIGETKGPDDRALIVGNAPNVCTGQPLGSVIDGFNHVARFNSYHVAKPAFTGSKVTHHFYNGRQSYETQGVQAVLPLFYVSLTHAVYLFFPRLEEAAQIRQKVQSGKGGVWVVDEDRLLALRNKIGLNFWQVPSSGMVAIDAFLSQHEHVYLHGFQFFQGKTIHYFDESITQLLTSWLERIMTHNPIAEKVWVEGMAKQDKVRFLPTSDLAKLAATLPEEDGEEDAADVKKASKEGDAGVARRGPGLLKGLLKDGFPSQFSL